MILDDIAEKTKERVERKKIEVPLADVMKKAKELPGKEHSFYHALAKDDVSFICEVKKASPSKGIIAEHFPYKQIALEYVEAGADAISVLTEPDFFLGNDEYLRTIASSVPIPVLRKDFTIDEYQIYEAKTLGAASVLLICSLLHKDQLEKYMKIADSLGIDALVEAHDVDEIQMAVEAGAKIIGVNNRNLKNFQVDIHNSLSLRRYIPKNVIFVVESGIQSAKDIQQVRKVKGDAVLVGETLMRSKDKTKTLQRLRG